MSDSTEEGLEAMTKLACLLAAVGTMTLATSAGAVPVITAVNANLAAAPYTFSYMGAAFTFGATGDIFGPLNVRDTADGAISSFGGFLGIPVSPSPSFTNRGTVTYGPSDSFAAFPTTTAVSYSNGKNFLGLRVTSGGSNYYGFAYTTNSVLNSFGFETAADTAITATTAIPAVPEPATWVMLLFGFAMTGAAVRYGRRRTAVRYA